MGGYRQPGRESGSEEEELHYEGASRALGEPGQVVNRGGASDGVDDGIVADVPEKSASWPAHADAPQ
eukprot:11163198-Lingulodinium_polyedra.AAC.1